MIGLAVVAALLTVIGCVAAVSARDSRLVALGLLLAMMAAPLASSSQPSALAIAFRFVGGLLAAYLLWASARARSIASEGSGIGAVAELAVAAAAFSIGWFVAPVTPLTGPIAAQAAGFSLLALAVAPLAARNVFRVGVGVAVVTLGISLLFQAWTGPATPMQQVALTALLVGVLGATSLLISPRELALTKRVAPIGPSDEEQPPDGAAGSAASESGSTAGFGAARAQSQAPARAPASQTESAAAAQSQPEPTPHDSPLSNRPRRLHPREPRR
jgi:hypothetical protein